MNAAATAPEQARVEVAHAPMKRLTSIDAYRGLVMFLMMAEVLAIGAVARNLPESAFWKFLHAQQSHVEWIGCVLHDLIQPSFSFLVGVALPFSIAARISRGQALSKMLDHALWRSLLLIALGIFLRSMPPRTQTYFTFEDTLTQIGLGYPFLFLLGLRSARVQWSGFALIVAGCWLAFALYPLPGPEFDWKAVGVPADWPHLQGFAAHWDKNSNLAWAFDRWFLNLFPREKPFQYNGGGYATLSFIPTLGTMILGLIAGGWLKADLSHRQKLLRFGAAAAAGFALGLALHYSGVCPIVKRIWTPTWVLFSGGWCFAFLAVFYQLVEVRRWHAWFFPLTVIGMNSIAAYCIAHLFDRFIGKSLDIHLGGGFFNAFGAYRPFVHGALVLFILWLILFWMYRRKLFLKI